MQPCDAPQECPAKAHVFFTGDLLYWQAHEEGLPLAVEAEHPDNLDHARVIQLHWDWDFGYRVGIGYTMGHGGWDLSLHWLRFYTDASRSQQASRGAFFFPSQVHPVNLPTASTFCTQWHSHWQLHLNQIDLSLSRSFEVSRWLTLQPRVGLCSAWIDQKWHIDYDRVEGIAGHSIKDTSKNDYWGLGPCVGLNTQWGFGRGWSLYGNGDLAILYGFFAIDRQEKVAGLDTGIPLSIDNSYRVSKVVADLQLGLRYERAFVQDRLHLLIQTGWELPMYFGQNQFPSFTSADSLGDFVANQGDLTLQGWTLSMQLGF